MWESGKEKTSKAVVKNYITLAWSSRTCFLIHLLPLDLTHQTGDMKTIFAMGIINWNKVKMNEASEDKTRDASKMELDQSGERKGISKQEES